nr:MAG TPA: hypothetical protein [Caudoviricetes sp.]
MEWLIGGLIAALIGAGMQQHATASATRKANQRMKMAQYELGQSQDKINQQIADATANYEIGNREQNQAAEADRIASEIKNDVAESQAIRDEQQATAGNVSNDYQQARTQSQAKTQAQANAFADLVAQIRSAGNLRMNEGFRLNRYGQNIDQLAKNARGLFTVRQAQAQDDLHSKDALKNWGQAIQIAGTIASMYGAGAGAGAGAAGSGSGGTIGSGLTTTGTGVNAGLSASATGASGLTAANGGATLMNATGPGLWGTLSNFWSGLTPMAKAGIVTGGSVLGQGLMSRMWK